MNKETKLIFIIASPMVTILLLNNVFTKQAEQDVVIVSNCATISAGGKIAIMPECIVQSSLQPLNQTQIDCIIISIGNNQCSLNIQSIVGLSTVYYELEVFAEQSNNAAYNVQCNIQSPSNEIMEAIQYNFDPTGGQDNIVIETLVRGFDASPETGNYHMNCTTLILNGGIFRIDARYLQGII